MATQKLKLKYTIFYFTQFRLKMLLVFFLKGISYYKYDEYSLSETRFQMLNKNRMFNPIVHDRIHIF